MIVIFKTGKIDSFLVKKYSTITHGDENMKCMHDYVFETSD